MRVKPESEAGFQRAVIDMAHARGWLVAHFRAAQVTRRGGKRWATPVSADGAGFPDLVLARRGVVMMRELKTERGRVSDMQARWISELGVFGKVWRPSDWPEISRELM